MKNYLLPILLSFLTIGVFTVHAAGYIVTCDGSDCTWLEILRTLRNIIRWALGFGVLYAFFRIALLAVKYGFRADSPDVRKEFTNNSIIIIIATFIFVGLLPLTSLALKTLKVSPNFVQMIDCLDNEKSCAGLFKTNQTQSMHFFTHAYAGTGVLAGASPIAVSDPFDFAVSAIQLGLQLLFVALVITWVVAGFILVAARGNPSELEKGKNMLWYCVYATVILFLMQALLFGLASVLGIAISK